ncbi:hypothetical protein ACFL5F_07655 [Planctomycetota bacterium]
MKIKIRYLLFILLALLLLAVCVEFLLGFPRVFSINRDFDLNSGDVRWYTYACFLKIKDEIKTTQFSQEIRRLGIEIPLERKWVGTYTKLFTILRKIYICYVYGGTPTECNYLITLFDKGNVSDENRRIILQKFMTFFADRRPPQRGANDNGRSTSRGGKGI